jgi:hypothetical protein
VGVLCLAAQVVTFDMSGLGAVNRYGAEPRTRTEVEGRKLECGKLAQFQNMAGAAGVGVRMEGLS